jgi:thiamine-phosphate pyrophosphorylase
MRHRCLLYYITNRNAFEGDEPTRQGRLLEKIAEATRAGVDYIQLREKDLPSTELEKLARKAANIVRSSSQPRTALLINSRTDAALSTQADGVHLRSDDILPSEVRKIWSCGAGAPARENSPQDPIIAVSCHSPQEVAQAARNAVNFAVFAPIFEKKDRPGSHVTGLAALAEACCSNIPVLALGGITLENAQSCLDAGAAGIAAIRLFQQNIISEVIGKLRS